MNNNPSKECIISENVFKRTKFLIEKSNLDAIALRISVEGGGCSGFKYKYELTNEIKAGDVINEKDGIKVVIDPISAPFLKKASIDYIEELGGAYFEIKNPNASSKCGCGSSFGI